MAEAPPAEPAPPSPGRYRADVRAGFVASVPLMLGSFPFGIAYATGARAVGFSPLEAMLGSLIVFAGSAQFAIVALTGAGAGPLAILLTTVGLNLRHLLYGMTVAEWLPEPVRPPRGVLAWFLTDESFGVAARLAAAGNPRSGVFLGAGLGTWLPWQAGTVVGLLLASAVPDLSGLGLDVVFPVSFAAMLVPLLRRRAAVAVALLAAGLGVGLRPLVGPGFAILVAALAGVLLGTLLDRAAARPAAVVAIETEPG